MRKPRSTHRRRPILKLRLENLEAREVPATLEIISLGTTNSAVVDHNALTGDDRGGIAVTPDKVFITGDNATAGFDLDLTNGADIGSVRDAMFSDIKTGDLFTLGTATATPAVNSGTNTITHLLGLDALTGALTGAEIALSSPVTMDTSNSKVGIFAGANRVVLYDSLSGDVSAVDTSTGTVTTLGTLTLGAFNPNESENWAIWGVAEEFGGEDYLTYRQNGASDIVRTKVSDGTTSVVASFADLSDLASFTVSPVTNRWYFHYEGVGEFGGSSETLGYADAEIVLTTFADISRVAPNTRTQAVGSVDITFLAPINAATFNFQDVILRRNGGVNLITPAVTVTGLGGNTFRIGNLASLTDVDGSYSLSVVGAGINDAGNTPLSGDERTQWVFDSTLQSAAASGPAGSLVQVIPTETRELLAATDVQAVKFTAALGQTISLAVTPEAGLQVSVSLIGPGGNVIATASGAAAGDTVLLNGITAAASGAYTVSVSPLAGTSGAFALDVTLNASLEAEELGGADNGTRATAQPLIFRTLSPGASVAAVNGTVDAAAIQGNAFLTDVNFNSGPQTANLAVAAIPAGGGILRITTVIDNGSSDETVDVDIEGVVSTTLNSNPSGNDEELMVYEIPLSASELATLLADSQIDVTLTPSPSVDDFPLQGGTAQIDVIFATAADSLDDFYSLSLTLGDRVSVVTSGAGINTDGQVEIQDSAGLVLASSLDTGANVGQSIADFTAAATGTFFVHVARGSALPYTLVVTKGAAFDLEPNNAIAQGLTGRKAVLGFADSSGDRYSFNLAAGAKFSWGTSNPGASTNQLDAALELYDPNGVLVASNDNGGGDGRSATLRFTVVTAGIYTLRVFGVNNTSGEYLLREQSSSTNTRVVVAPDKGSQPIQVFANGQVVLTIPTPFGAAYTGQGIRVAQGDVTGDGVPDIIAGNGPKATSQVRVFDGVTGAAVLDIIPFKKARAGVFVAAGDVNGDGRADIFVGGQSGNKVLVFNAVGGALLKTFVVKGYGGVHVAAGDVNGDGVADLIAGKRTGSHVRIMDGASTTGAILSEYDAFAKTHRRGVFVAAGDVDGDGKADVIVGAGAGKGSAGLVSVFKGTDSSLLYSNAIFGAGFIGGIRVAAGDVNGDGFADIIVGAGSFAPKVSIVDGFTKEKKPDLLAFDSLTDPVGVFVG